MRTTIKQIKEAESTFRLAGAGVENYEKTIAGTEAKLPMQGQKLAQQQRAVEQYSWVLVAANDKLRENYNRRQDYSQRIEQAIAPHLKDFKGVNMMCDIRRKLGAPIFHPGRAHLLTTSSSQAPYRSSCRKRRASLIPLLLLSPQSRLCGGPFGRW